MSDGMFVGYLNCAVVATLFWDASSFFAGRGIPNAMWEWPLAAMGLSFSSPRVFSWASRFP